MRACVRAALCAVVVLFLISLAPSSFAQGDSASVNGRITDPNGLPIPNVKVRAVNVATNVTYPGETNDVGLYNIPGLPPGTYRIIVEKEGFAQVVKPDVVLHVADISAINFALRVGSVSETVTVQAGAPLVDTQSGAVGTVIDHTLVENLPLNGRSFNTLLQLTPGVVLAHGSGNANSEGQFSISGQRTSSNNFLVDGVSANFGIAPTVGLGNSGTGGTQAFSALGGTSSLVSVEALQEFRVETSSYAAEFGRSPGGQVMLTTRSGANDFHGGVYEYFRNDMLDANDWFANQAGKSRAPERHNDFGGFFGGPFLKDKTFFFLSYEGARLRQPSTMVTEVPSEYARTQAPASVAPFLLAYPEPDDKTIVPGVYTGQFAGSFSNPSTLNAGSVRIDHAFNNRFSIFARYNEAPSDTATRDNALSQVDTTGVGTRTFTAGATMFPRTQVSNTLRGNYSLQTGTFTSTLIPFAGAVPPGLDALAPNLPNAGRAYVAFITFDTGYYAAGPDARNRTRQLNFADDLAVSRGAHHLKVGADYRAIFLDLEPSPAFLEYIVDSVPDLIASGQATVFSSSAKSSQYLSQSTSLYAQDSWKVDPRLTLTYGLRWELSPAPSARNGTTLASWTNVDTPARTALAPFGTPLWRTTYTNFAPRFGLAYLLTPGGDFVLRAGAGIFYDLASDSVGYLGAFFPNDTAQCCLVASLPLTDASADIPPLSDQPPYPDGVRGFNPHLKLPRSYQWNLSLEKAFGSQQALTVSYVGQAGRELLRQEDFFQPNSNFLGAFVVTQNNARSNYEALQVQYRRPFRGRVQALLNYTFSHSLDSASDDINEAISHNVVSAANDYASSEFDVRHSFSGAVTWAIPGATKSQALGALTKDWSLESVVVARSGFPFNAAVLTQTVGGAYPRPDLVPGQPVWIANPNAGGGKSLNPAAFVIPPAGRQGTEPRNDIGGFGLTQVDLSLGRKFHLSERVALQFRTDAFNLLNHPNFRNPFGYVGFGPSYLKSPYLMNRGLGGLNPLFQEGGPRSLQLSLRLAF